MKTLSQTEVIVEIAKHLAGKHNQKKHAGDDAVDSSEDVLKQQFAGRTTSQGAGAGSPQALMMGRIYKTQAMQVLGESSARIVEETLPGVKIRPNTQFYSAGATGGMAYMTTAVPKVVLGLSDNAELNKHTTTHEILHVAERNPKSPLSGKLNIGEAAFNTTVLGNVSAKGVAGTVGDTVRNMGVLANPVVKNHLTHVEEPTTEALAQISYKRQAGSKSPFLAYPAQMNMLGDALKENGVSTPEAVEQSLKAMHYDAGANQLSAADKAVRDTLVVKSAALNKAVGQIVQKSILHAYGAGATTAIRERSLSQGVTALGEALMKSPAVLGVEGLQLSQPSISEATGIAHFDSTILKAVRKYSRSYRAASLLVYAGFAGLAQDLLAKSKDMSAEEKLQLQLMITDRVQFEY